MKRLIPALLVACGLVGFGGTVQAQVAATPQARIAAPRIAPPRPTAVARNAAISNQFEIESSRVALLKSRNPNVRRFARRMIADHTALAARMRQALRLARLPVPSAQLDPAHRQMLRRLQALSGANFDRHYMRDQVNGHLQAVALMSRYSRTGSNPVLRRLASNALPVIEHHLVLARQLEAGSRMVASR